MSVPSVGVRFAHKYWTDKDGTPIVFEVTAVRNGVAYIRAEGERKAKELVPLARWGRVCGEVLIP